MYKGKDETVMHKGNGYTVEMRENCGNYHATLIWQKRGRVPNIVSQLKPVYTEPNDKLRSFRSRSDAMAVMELLKGYMAEYESKRK